MGFFSDIYFLHMRRSRLKEKENNLLRELNLYFKLIYSWLPPCLYTIYSSICIVLGDSCDMKAVEYLSCFDVTVGKIVEDGTT